jgi:hypothetical protein
MNESSLTQENNISAPEAKLFGLSRPVIGALIGILLYLLLFLLSLATKLEVLGITLLLPGLLAAYFLDSQFFGEILLLGVPSIPFALFGSLIISKDRTKRVLGIVWSIIYFLLLIVVGLHIAPLYVDR